MVMRQLVLREPVQGIRLIFVPVQRPAQGPAARVLVELRAGIMPGRQIFRAQPTRFCHQRVKLDIPIAVDARVRGAPALVFGHKVVNDFFRKELPKVENIMGNAKLCRHPAGILHRAEGAAARAFGFRCAFLPNLHGDAQHVITLPQQKARRDRRIHPAAHGDHHCLLCCHNSYPARCRSLRNACGCFLMKYFQLSATERTTSSLSPANKLLHRDLA